MGDEAGESPKHPDDVKLSGSADFKGPAGKRHCTDGLCCILIIAMWTSMTGLGLVVMGFIDGGDMLKEGDPNRLTHGVDKRGNICGVDFQYTAASGDNKARGNPDNDIVKDKPFMYPFNSGSGICVEECPSADDYTKGICDYSDQTAFDALNTAQKGAKFVEQKCMPQLATSKKGYYCVFDQAISVAASAALDADAADALNQGAEQNNADEAKEAYENFVADIKTTWQVIAGFGFGFSMVASFVYLQLLHLPGFLVCFIWGTIVAIFGSLAGLGAFLSLYTAKQWAAEDPKIHTDAQTQGVLYGGYVLIGLAGLWLLLICCLRKRIFLAIAITKEAARAIGAMPLLVLFPLIQALGLLAFSAVWNVIMIYLASSGDLVKSEVTMSYSALPSGATTQPTVEIYEFVYDDNVQYAGWYLLFCYYWTSEFITAFGQIVMAMAVAYWYFSRDKANEIGNRTVFRSICATFRYHTGTAAFGSLIIAIIKTIRAIIASFQKKALAAANKAKNSGNAAAVAAATAISAVLCAIQCCMWCIEKCMKFLNKNAYIQTAIFGYSFCKSARKAFFLILRNLLRIAACLIVSDFVILLGLILVPSATTAAGYFFIQHYPPDHPMADHLNSLVGPLATLFIVSYFTTRVFNEVFSMAISTVLQCYVADEEMFEPAERFAEGSLKSAISKTNEEHAATTKKVKVVPLDQSDSGTKVEAIGEAPKHDSGD